jgi:hypothetical protein
VVAKAVPIREKTNTNPKKTLANLNILILLFKFWFYFNVLLGTSILTPSRKIRQNFFGKAPELGVLSAQAVWRVYFPEKRFGPAAGAGAYTAEKMEKTLRNVIGHTETGGARPLKYKQNADGYCIPPRSRQTIWQFESVELLFDALFFYFGS